MKKFNQETLKMMEQHLRDTLLSETNIAMNVSLTIAGDQLIVRYNFVKYGLAKRSFAPKNIEFHF